MVSGSLRQGTITVPVSEGRLLGEQITFTVAGTTYKGKVNGASMQGTTSAGAAWTATKAAQ
jgi:hypothetical protein